MNWQAIGTILGLISIAVTLAIFIYQSRRARLLAQADLILRWKQQFDSPETRRLRAKAAQGLLMGQESNQALSDVLDFFTDVASAVDLGVLDAHQAHVHFGYWIRGYWYNSQPFVQAERNAHPGSWQTLELVIKEVDKAYVEATAIDAPPDRNRFLTNEVAQWQLTSGPTNAEPDAAADRGQPGAPHPSAPDG